MNAKNLISSLGIDILSFVDVKMVLLKNIDRDIIDERKVKF